jgi:multiple sugar transport system permease protein
MRQRVRITREVAFWMALAATFVLVLAPIAWAFSTSLKSEAEILSAAATLVPENPTLDHYQKLARDGVDRAFLNSALVTAASIALTVILGASAGYVLSRYALPGRDVILAFLVATMTVPVVIILVPLQLLLANLGLLSNLLVLSLLYTALIIPLAVWIMKAHFDSVPISLEQAAWVDGYSRTSTFIRIVLPGTRAAVLAVVVVAFLNAWNDYIVAATMTITPAERTAQVALIWYQGTFGREWGPLMAGVVVATIPPVIIFLLTRRNLVKGVAAGGIKG